MIDNIGGYSYGNKCDRACLNKTIEGYCMTTTCIYPECPTTSTSSYTYSTSKSFGECDSCTHREVCKFKNDFKDAKNKFYEKNSKLPILRVQCIYYESRSIGITYTGNENDQFLKPPYEVTCGSTAKGDTAHD